MSDPSVGGEFGLIALIRERVAAAGVSSDVVIGPGDDAAVVVPPPGEHVVVTTDALVESRHFDSGADAADVGWKTLAVSISDVAAMGARARWAVVGLAVPADRASEFVPRFLDGVLACASEYGVTLVGGDLTGAPREVNATGTVMGTARPADIVRRSGARPGDAICVTGALGGSRAGRHLRPEPRQKEALSLVKGGGVTAMIDLSDGLSSDLGHVLDASGVGAELWAERIPIHADAAGDLQRALHDGEDFELCFCTDAGRAEELESTGLGATPVSIVGRVTAEQSYVLLERADAPESAQPVARGGHDHFRAG